MTRWLLTSMTLAGVFTSYANATEPVQPAGSATPSTAHPGQLTHLSQAKEFAVTALDARIRILQIERACVSAALEPKALRSCDAQARAARQKMQSRLAPAFNQLPVPPKH